MDGFNEIARWMVPIMKQNEWFQYYSTTNASNDVATRMLPM